jgi:hypothetical protein
MDAVELLELFKESLCVTLRDPAAAVDHGDFNDSDGRMPTFV